MDETRFEVLAERWDNFMNLTENYRKELCSKIGKITDKLDALPCKERKGMYESVKGQLAAIWVIIVGILLFFFKEALTR